MSFDRIFRESARLTILRALADEPNDALNDSMLQAVLETFGINRSREWLRDELRVIAELGAITITVAGSVRIAQLTAKGRDHVERRILIEGIKRPSPQE
jgi:hypothetical protein